MFSECKIPRAWNTNIHLHADGTTYVLDPQEATVL